MKVGGCGITQKSCNGLMELEEKMKTNFYEIYKFKLVSKLLFLLNKQDAMLFILKKK